MITVVVSDSYHHHRHHHQQQYSHHRQQKDRPTAAEEFSIEARILQGRLVKYMSKPPPGLGFRGLGFRGIHNAPLIILGILLELLVYFLFKGDCNWGPEQIDYSTHWRSFLHGRMALISICSASLSYFPTSCSENLDLQLSPETWVLVKDLNFDTRIGIYGK